MNTGKSPIENIEDKSLTLLNLPIHFMKTVIEIPLVSQFGIGLMTKKCYDKLTDIPMTT